jgi:23S rRNA (uridine2552-2'-O)-methyltransferase
MAQKGKSSLKRGFLAAADLSELGKQTGETQNLFDGDNFFFIQGDVTTENVREALVSKGPYNVIISDAAPKTTGSSVIDSARSIELAETVLAYAEFALAPKGNLALKVFQGSDSAAFLKRMKGLFETVKSFKPQACRGESVETYFIGLGYKALDYARFSDK